MTQDAWRHDELGWLPHQPGVDDELLATTEEVSHHPGLAPMAAVAPLATAAIGVDVSGHQGSSINWAQVAASGRSYAMLKATEGVNYISPALDVQYQGATAAGLITGLYHFASPTSGDTPEAEADAFAAQVNRLGATSGHLPPCLDLETGTGNLSSWAQRFIARLRAQTGCVRILIYSGASFFQNQIGENGLDQNVALFIASWGTPPGQPSYNSPRVALHQYSSTGLVTGIAGNVDLSYAIWPLSTLVPSEAPPVTTPPAASTASVLTADEQAKLTGAFQQFSGSPVVGQWPGWPAFPGGSAGKSFTLVDWCRWIDVQNVALKAELDSLKAQAAITPGTPAALSAADKTDIAAAVIAMLAARLQS